MKFWEKVKKIKIKDADFHNVPPQTAYTFIIIGLVHFMVIGSVFIDLRTIEQYNWGIFKSLGLADTFQLPLIAGLMIFNAFLMIYGVYLLKHVAPTKEEEEKEFKRKHDINKDDYSNN